tara:strand:+ start:600 stop:797 length:198 start_codon:yes stop_codon:yes gene_type:complete
MGNIFEKKTDLYHSMLEKDFIERMEYIENKLNDLDGLLLKLEGNTQANLKVLSADIHQIHRIMKK